MPNSSPIDQSFPQNYVCDILSELPNSPQRLFYFPNARTDGGRDGLLLEITLAKGISWVGVFAFGDFSGPSKVYSFPDRDRVCVVSRGNGYIVATDDPGQNEIVKVSPVLGVYPSLRHNIILFHDSTDFVAYGKNGIIWRSKRVSYDGIIVTSTDADFLVGRSWDAPTGGYIGFKLNLKTGEHEGGSYPLD